MKKKNKGPFLFYFTKPVWASLFQANVIKYTHISRGCALKPQVSFR